MLKKISCFKVNKEKKDSKEDDTLLNQDKLQLDLLFCVMTYLSIKDVGVVSATCRFWSMVANDDYLWKGFSRLHLSKSGEEVEEKLDQLTQVKASYKSSLLLIKTKLEYAATEKMVTKAWEEYDEEEKLTKKRNASLNQSVSMSAFIVDFTPLCLPFFSSSHKPVGAICKMITANENRSKLITLYESQSLENRLCMKKK